MSDINGLKCPVKLPATLVWTALVVVVTTISGGAWFMGTQTATIATLIKQSSEFKTDIENRLNVQASDRRAEDTRMDEIEIRLTHIEDKAQAQIDYLHQNLPTGRVK